MPAVQTVFNKIWIDHAAASQKINTSYKWEQTENKTERRKKYSRNASNSYTHMYRTTYHYQFTYIQIGTYFVRRSTSLPTLLRLFCVLKIFTKLNKAENVYFTLDVFPQQFAMDHFRLLLRKRTFRLTTAEAEWLVTIYCRIWNLFRLCAFYYLSCWRMSWVLVLNSSYFTNNFFP